MIKVCRTYLIRNLRIEDALEIRLLCKTRKDVIARAAYIRQWKEYGVRMVDVEVAVNTAEDMRHLAQLYTASSMKALLYQEVA